MQFVTKHTTCALGLWLAALTPAWASGAAEFQDHASILDTAREFLEQTAQTQHTGRSEVNLGKLDKRLRLRVCGEPLQASMPAGARTLGNTTVAVECASDTGWKIYVTGKISVFGEVLVARESIGRKQPLAARQVHIAERELGSLSAGYLSDRVSAVGMLAKRNIAAGTVLTPNMLEAPRLIRRGERVTLLATTGGIEVRMRGEALADAAHGERVRIRALSSKRVVEGVALSSGVVKMTL